MAGTESDLHIYLRPWRHYRGLTLEKVGKSIGHKANTISGWEIGTRTVDLDDLKKLADVYMASPADLLFPPPHGRGDQIILEATALLRKMSQERADIWINLGKIIAGLE